MTEPIDYKVRPYQGRKDKTLLLPLMRDRLMSALTGTQDVLDTMLGSLGTQDARWDTRPDPARFTLREIIAHLANYESI